MDTFRQFFKNILIAGVVIYAIFLLLTIYFLFFRKDYFVHSALFHLLLWGIVLINVHQYGRREATVRLVIVCLIGSTALWSGIASLLLSSPKGIYYYQWLWLLAMVIGFLLPLYDSTRTISGKSFTHLFVLFIAFVLCGVGSIYIPMRASTNAVGMRLNSPAIAQEMASDIEQFGAKEAMNIFQMRYLYQRGEREETWCSRKLRSILDEYLRPESLPLHQDR